MSCFVVSSLHISALVTALLDFGIIEKDETADVGAALWAENYASFNDRYSASPHIDSESGPEPYTFRRAAYTHPFVLKLVHCYEHQASEHEGWRTSTARVYMQALAAMLARHTSRNDPKYLDAPWGVS